MTSGNARRSIQRWLIVVIATGALLVAARWWSTSTRRVAYDRLSMQPCGFLPGFMGGYHNPTDFLSVRGDTWYTDLLRPPTITAIELRDVVDTDTLSLILTDAAVFVELQTLVLPDGTPESQINLCRQSLTPNVYIHVHPEVGVTP
jgi:hypothetical protein